MLQVLIFRAVFGSANKLFSLLLALHKVFNKLVLLCFAAATNTLTGEMLNPQQAAALNILDARNGTYTDLRSQAKMLIGDAVDKKLVEVAYDTKATGKTANRCLPLTNISRVNGVRPKSFLFPSCLPFLYITH